MDEKELISDWERKIIEIFQRENLTCLRGLNSDPDQRYRYKGVQLLLRYNEVTRRCVMKHVKAGKSFEWHALETDLYFLSDEALYYLAHAYLYRPYLNNPLEHAHRPSGYSHTIYPNIQNVESKRYDMHVDTAFEKLYGFWNRLATLINYFLFNPLKNTAVDFSRVMDAIPSAYHQSQDYKWLLSFKEKEYKTFNDRRKAVVHHSTTGTNFGQQHLKAKGNNARQEVERLVQERYELVDFLRENMYLVSETYIHTLDLLAEIDAQEFNLPEYEN